MIDEYHSIKADVSKTMKVEGSKFIASAYPVDSRQQAEEKLGNVRKKFFNLKNSSMLASGS
jgi:putative IMPACT (imprinted ancient) family translation regulator